MKGSNRVGPWRFSARVVTRDPGQLLLVGLICALAASAGIAAHAATLRETARLQAYSERRHGSVSLVYPSMAIPSQPGSDEPAGTQQSPTEPDGGREVRPVLPIRRYPVLASVDTAIPGPHYWLTRNTLSALEPLAADLGLALFPRIEAAAYTRAQEVRRLIAVTRSDPARDLIDSRDPQAPGLYVAVTRSTNGVVEWHDVPSEVIYGIGEDGTYWTDISWLTELLSPTDSETVVEIGAHIAANVAVLVAPGRNPFSLAFELEELGGDLAANARFRAWPELVGYERYVGTGGGAALLRPLILFVAIMGAAGAVAVATRNRMRDIVLLRTLGMSTGAVRALYVRETLIASLAGTVLAAVISGLVWASGTEALPPLLSDPTVRRVLLGTLFLPPLVAFLTMRRQLLSPLARIRREAEL